MKLYSIEAGNYKIDGGAAFGTVPKSIWEKLYKADKDNLIVISQRCLLIEDAEHIILVDTGMGNKQSEKFYS
ncbi:MAG TPA: MBL fold metallo-hydrolase, partial [Bacteroidales bacterium]|nr:MBL fold metallo-hydrolase [Bacteroidales bacterium]